MSVLLIIIGLAGLIIGSEVAVNGAKRVAERMRVSPLFVGLTIASIGTSLPEIATNVGAGFAVAQGEAASGIAVGNILGSNISQITLLLGVTALLGPLIVSRQMWTRDGPMLFIALGWMWLACLDGDASQIEGGIGIAIYIVYLGVLWRRERLSAPLPPSPDDDVRSAPIAMLMMGVGLAMLVLSADLIITEGVELARAAGVSELTIGLFVGVATGLPELAVALRGVFSQAGDIALGNLIGSNITDPLLSFGAGAVVAPMAVEEVSLSFDFPFLVAVTAIALALLAWKKGLDKFGALTLIVLAGVYVAARAYVLAP